VAAPGFAHKRRAPIPSTFYIDGFGYIDTGELETVRAIFYFLSLQYRSSRLAT